MRIMSYNSNGAIYNSEKYMPCGVGRTGGWRVAESAGISGEHQSAAGGKHSGLAGASLQLRVVHRLCGGVRSLSGGTEAGWGCPRGAIDFPAGSWLPAVLRTETVRVPPDREPSRFAARCSRSGRPDIVLSHGWRTCCGPGRSPGRSLTLPPELRSPTRPVLKTPEN